MSNEEITWLEYEIHTSEDSHQNGISTDAGQFFFGKDFAVPDDYIEEKNLCRFYQA